MARLKPILECKRPAAAVTNVSPIMRPLNAVRELYKEK
jgi:hypothetical protein